MASPRASQRAEWDYSPKHHRPESPKNETKNTGAIDVNGTIMSPRRITSAWQDSLTKTKKETQGWNSEVEVKEESPNRKPKKVMEHVTKAKASESFKSSLRQDASSAPRWDQDTSIASSEDRIRRCRSSEWVSGAEIRRKSVSWAETLKPDNPKPALTVSRSVLSATLESLRSLDDLQASRPELKRAATDFLPMRTQSFSPKKTPRRFNKKESHSTFTNMLRTPRTDAEDEAKASMDFSLEKDEKNPTHCRNSVGCEGSRVHADASKYFHEAMRA